LHFTTYVPIKYATQALEWNGGFVDYDGAPENRSDLKTLETDVTLPSLEHPVIRGVTPYHYKDEFYYKMHLLWGDPNLTPLVRVSALSPNTQEQTVAWAFQRKNGGRSVGATFGHYYENWRLNDYRKLILNAIVWTAGMDVPSQGVASTFVEEEEIEKAADAVHK
jgi:type 1 glutamine amidotransferase